jgi:GNAT superfamily N-acetyltransferase
MTLAEKGLGARRRRADPGEKTVTWPAFLRGRKSRYGAPADGIHPRNKIVHDPSMSAPDNSVVRVTYMEARQPPPPPSPRAGPERVALEHPSLNEYLTLYRSVGEPLRWDQRLMMPEEELRSLLASDSLRIHVLRNSAGDPIGLCEFDHSTLPEIELKNFGLIPAAQGAGLGPWLLTVALYEEWKFRPTRIWLHTDNWDHPAAIRVYERAGFRVYDQRDEPPGML